MKRVLLLLCCCIACSAYAQTAGEKSYIFLELPVSAHAAALGGENITVIDDDVNLALHNPALLSSVSDKTLSLGYMNYMDGINNFHAAYSQIAGRRSTWAVAANYLDYGTISRRDDQDIDLGSFNAKDMDFMGLYAYNLTDYWSGGVTAKMIYSTYDSYSAFAMGVDLGVNYYNAKWDFSFSAAAKNLGGQLSSFDETNEKLPIDLQMGATKRLAHAPIALSLTLSRLNNWDIDFMQHFNFGVDINFSKNLYVAAGYNCRKASEMKVGESSNGAAWSFGAGLHIKRIKLDAAYGKYHVSGGALVMNISYAL